MSETNGVAVVEAPAVQTPAEDVKARVHPAHARPAVRKAVQAKPTAVKGAVATSTSKKGADVTKAKAAEKPAKPAKKPEVKPGYVDLGDGIVVRENWLRIVKFLRKKNATTAATGVSKSTCMSEGRCDGSGYTELQNTAKPLIVAIQASETETGGVGRLFYLTQKGRAVADKLAK